MPKALPRVGSCPAPTSLPRVGSTSPLRFSRVLHTRATITVYLFSFSPGRFIARVSASVATAEGRPGRFCLPLTLFASSFVVLTKGSTGPAEALAAATTAAQPNPLPRSYTQEMDSTAITGPIVSTFASLGTPAPPSGTPPSEHISTRTRGRTATATGNAPPL